MKEVGKKGVDWTAAKLFCEKFPTLAELFQGTVSQVWVSPLVPATLRRNS